MDIGILAARMMAEGITQRIASNPQAQFGTPTRRYIGAELLPERTVEENEYTEEGVRWRTPVATDKERYSPPEMREGMMVGNVKVTLGESGIANQFTSRDYDSVRRMLQRGGTMEAMMTMMRWQDRALLRPMVEKCEAKRWQFLAEGTVLIQGANGFVGTWLAPVIPGQRAAVGGDWDDPTYDPFDDIYERQSYMASKGYRIRRIITSTAARAKFVNNPKVAARLNRVIVAVGGAPQMIAGRPTIDQVNMMLQQEGLPAIEVYDLMYQTLTGQRRFLKEDVMMFIAETDLEESTIINNNPDGAPVVRVTPSTLGYYAIGRNAGQPAPGRIIRIQAYTGIPPHIGGEAAQTEGPVVLDVEAFCTLTGITL